MRKQLYICLLLGLIIVSFAISYFYFLNHANPFNTEVVVPDIDFELGASRIDYLSDYDQLVISTYYSGEPGIYSVGLDSLRYLTIASYSKQPLQIYGGDSPQAAVKSDPVINCSAATVCSYTPDLIENYYVINGQGQIYVQIVAANSSTDVQNAV